MSEFIRFEDLSLTALVSLNIMCKHKKVIHKSDIVLCDGKTIKAEMLPVSPGHSDYHKFPTQHPTPADLAIWNTALCRLSSAFLVLMVKLQEYIGPPHSSLLWLLNNLGTTLHHNMVRDNKLYYEMYSPSWTRLLAGLGLDNVTTQDSLPMDITISGDVQAWPYCRKGRSSFIPCFFALSLYNLFLVSKM
jgi:hypothetical protein